MLESFGQSILKNNAVKMPRVGTTPPQSALERENRALKARLAKLERLAVCDTLTPLFNRRHFMDELSRWCWRTHRYGGEYGLLFIDVDNLKSVNDSHGHLAGDIMLTAVAKALLASVRRSDVVARVGGDEFAILLDSIPASIIADKAANITEAVANLEIPYQGHCLIPNVSVGFTPLEAGVKPVELLLRADRSMYAAKQAKGMGQHR